ncbi:hypothetical protein [Pseudanabaena sp. ABRG5-3]|uniref:hypothetical protein n=1 Tax=Pseudanabaena sp. ABRG5-3 TaxID=685565 RepID=UPI000DC6F17F|nr:hypothetical protein [Pseudanabaena sp. ABRG5-3]BBC22717.1 hypothetical protein ABRG53_0460 [Pseudanabaena sp. ABRG5-3]
MVTVIYILVLALVLWLILAIAEDSEKRQLIQKREADKEFVEIERQNREDEKLRATAINIKIDILKNRVEQLFNELKFQFDETIANKILEELNVSELNIPDQSSYKFYTESLALIVTHKSSNQTKLFAVNVGRWYYKNMDFHPLLGSKEIDEFIQEDINDIQK